MITGDTQLLSVGATAQPAVPLHRVSVERYQPTFTFQEEHGLVGPIEKQADIDALMTSDGHLLKVLLGYAASGGTYLKSARASAGTFESFVTVDSSTTLSLYVGCSLVRSGDTIHVFFHDYSDNKFYYRPSTNNGQSWGSRVEVGAGSSLGATNNGRIGAVDLYSFFWSEFWYGYHKRINRYYYDSGWVNAPGRTFSSLASACDGDAIRLADGRDLIVYSHRGAASTTFRGVFHSNGAYSDSFRIAPIKDASSYENINIARFPKLSVVNGIYVLTCQWSEGGPDNDDNWTDWFTRCVFMRSKDGRWWTHPEVTPLTDTWSSGVLVEDGSDLWLVGVDELWRSDLTQMFEYRNEALREDITDRVKSWVLNWPEQGIAQSSMILSNEDGYFDDHAILNEENTVLVDRGAGYSLGVVPIEKPHLWLYDASSRINCGDDSSIGNLWLSSSGAVLDLWARITPSHPDNVYLAYKRSLLSEGWSLDIDTEEGILIASILASFGTPPSSIIPLDIDGEWHHYVMAYNNSGDRKIYLAVDGEWAGTYDLQSAATGTLSSDVNLDLYLGSSSDAGGGVELSWVRMSDDMRFTPGVDFAAPYLSAPPDVDLDTVELWKMAEGAGVYAESENYPVNDGALTDVTWVLPLPVVCVEEVDSIEADHSLAEEKLVVKSRGRGKWPKDVEPSDEVLLITGLTHWDDCSDMGHTAIIYGDVDASGGRLEAGDDYMFLFTCGKIEDFLLRTDFNLRSVDDKTHLVMRSSDNPVDEYRTVGTYLTVEYLCSTNQIRICQYYPDGWTQEDLFAAPTGFGERRWLSHLATMQGSLLRWYYSVDRIHYYLGRTLVLDSNFYAQDKGYVGCQGIVSSEVWHDNDGVFDTEPFYTLEDIIRALGTYAGILNFDFDSTFEDDFGGSALGEDWDLTSSSATASVGAGKVTLSAPASGWEYLYTARVMPRNYVVTFHKDSGRGRFIFRAIDSTNFCYFEWDENKAIVGKVENGYESPFIDIDLAGDWDDRVEVVVGVRDDFVKVWMGGEFVIGSRLMVTGTDMEWEYGNEEFMGFGVSADNALSILDIRIPELTDIIDFTSMIPGETPEAVMRRAIGEKHVSMWVRPDGSLRAIRALAPQDEVYGYASPQNFNLARDTRGLVSHLRVVGAWEWADVLDDSLLDEIGHRFKKVDNSDLMSQADCAKEAAYLMTASKSLAEQVGFDHPAVPLLEIEDRIGVTHDDHDGDYRVSSQQLAYDLADFYQSVQGRKYYEVAPSVPGIPEGEVAIPSGDWAFFGPEIDWYMLRQAWRDDFQGQALHPPTSTQVTGSSTAALYSMGGGVLRLRCGPTSGDAAILWVANNTDNTYRTLKNAQGFIAISRFKLPDITYVRHHMGGSSFAGADRSFFCVDTDISNNWLIEIQNGARTQYDTGVAIDTDWHIATIQARADGVTLWLDGEYLGRHGVATSANTLRPVLSAATLTNAYRDVYIDYFIVIPE